jgi:hypothetical protein
MLEVRGSSETSLDFQLTMRRYGPEDSTLQIEAFQWMTSCLGFALN